MNKLKNNPLLLIGSIISLVIGLMLVFTDYQRIINFIYFVVGGGLIITGISKLIIENNTQDKSYMYDGIIDIVIGIFIMFVHDLIVTVILGILFIIFPIVRIIKSDTKKYTFKKELPLLIIGFVIALSGDLIAGIFIKILGVLMILLAIYLFVCIFTQKIRIINVGYHSDSTDNANKDIIDVECEESESDE